MKRILSAILTLVMCLSMVASLNVIVSAADYPSISSSKYIEFTAQQNINVYKDTACKTRGTSSPSQKYNASIATGDKCYIYEIQSNYIKVNYPTSSGRRTGYVKRTSLFDKTKPVEYIKSAKTKVNVYKSTSGSYIAKGDKVWRVDPKKGYEGYRAVIYEAKSGKRAYKMGYITLDDLSKIKGEQSNSETKQTTKKSAKVEFAKTQLDESLLESKFNAAQQVLDVVYGVNVRLAAEKALGVATISVITLNPAKMYSVMDEDAAIGLIACTISESYFQQAIASHNEFIKKSKKIETEAQAEAAFECFVDALSKYNAVINANMGTIDRYTGPMGKANYRNDMLNSYLSSVATAAIPASEYKAVVSACKIATTGSQLVNIVGDKYAGYDSLKSTRETWYSQWHKMDGIYYTE